MNNLKIKKIELTLFEIVLSNILEDRGGIGIKYLPGYKGKHIRFGIKIFDNLGNVGEYIPPRGRAKVIMSAAEALSYYILDQNPFFRDNIYRQLRGLTKHIGEVGIGAIDIAIYDLICKHLNISISDFLV